MLPTGAGRKLSGAPWTRGVAALERIPPDGSVGPALKASLTLRDRSRACGIPGTASVVQNAQSHGPSIRRRPDGPRQAVHADRYGIADRYDRPQVASSSPHRPHGTLVDELARQIHERVLSGAFPIGTWLRQETLAAEFAVSRTPIREALRKLQAEGVLLVEPNRGALVRLPTSIEVREAYRVRAELEGLAAQLAAESIDADGIARLQAAVLIFPRGTYPDTQSVSASWHDANNAFHDAIIGAAGNARLSRAIAELYGSFPRNLTWAALQGAGDLVDRSAAEHELILAAVISQEANEARTRMIAHVMSAGELLASWFQHQVALVHGTTGAARR